LSFLSHIIDLVTDLFGEPGDFAIAAMAAGQGRLVDSGFAEAAGFGFGGELRSGSGLEVKNLRFGGHGVKNEVRFTQIYSDGVDK